MVAELWFRSLWKTTKKHEASLEKAVIGVLAFEIASLMSKLIHLWHSLSEKQVTRLREEVSNSVGIKKLVSDDDDYVGRLIWAETVDNMVHVANSVARLGKKCSDPSLRSFERAFEDWIRLGTDPNGWVYTSKKMDAKAKKMEKFISLNASLYQEMEVFADLEQTLRRAKESDQPPEASGLSELQKKVTWKRHELKTLKDLSLWNRTYDYAVLLMARTLFTIYNRIKLVFGYSQVAGIDEIEDSGVFNTDQIYRTQSVSGLLQNSVHQTRSSGLPRFASGPLGNFSAKSGPFPSKASKANNFYSGPLNVGVATSAKSDPVATTKSRNFFYSGPIGRSIAKSGPISGISKYGKKLWQTKDSSRAANPKSGRSTQVGPFKGRMVAAGNNSPIAYGVTGADKNIMHLDTSSSILKCKLAVAPPETLGAAALALHYANVIVVVEKLAASPHLIGLDARDDLYNMLPASVRTSLREKLKPFGTKSLASSGAYDTALAREWSEAMAAILEWLGPLAHNTIRWQSERSFEQQNLASKGQVLLVQTLHFASQEKTEATISELLVGLNYIWRFGREVNAKAILDCTSSRIYDEYNLDLDG